MRSATPSHENRSASDAPSTSAAIQATPEPANPSQRIENGPSSAPNTPPAWPPGNWPSNRYSRVHSSAQLAAINSSSPSQKAERGKRVGCTGASCARSHPASADSHSRRPTTGNHHAE